MKRRNPRITLSVLPARAIYQAVLQFTQQHPLPRTKGRKPLYSEALILTLALLRMEQVFGSVKGVYGSSVGCRRWCYARVQVWGMLVLWNLVQRLRVGSDRGDCLCVVFVLWGD
jgi:hypothetical protein